MRISLWCPRDSLQCKHPRPVERGCKSACKTIIPPPLTDARENRVLSSCLTHSCVFSQDPWGVYHSSIHSIIPGTPGPSSEQGNEATCQGRRTKREHVEERIRLEEEVWGLGGGNIEEKKDAREEGTRGMEELDKGVKGGTPFFLHSYNVNVSFGPCFFFLHKPCVTYQTSRGIKVIFSL